MSRSLFALAVLLLAFVALAAPAPDPFGLGWSKPVDPDRDCKISRSGGGLTIEMPGTDHDYDPGRKRVNAPRILRDFEGDFDLQLRLCIDCRASNKSTVKDQPSYVAGGFLVIPPDPFFILFTRSQYGVAGEGIGADGFASELIRGRKGGHGNLLSDKRWKSWPFKAKPESVYLRLGREGDVLHCKISPDGKEWVSFGGGRKIGLPSKLKVGLAAFSTSSEPSKVRFDRIKVTLPKKKEDKN